MFNFFGRIVVRPDWCSGYSEKCFPDGREHSVISEAYFNWVQLLQVHTVSSWTVSSLLSSAPIVQSPNIWQQAHGFMSNVIWGSHSTPVCITAFSCSSWIAEIYIYSYIHICLCLWVFISAFFSTNFCWSINKNKHKHGCRTSPFDMHNGNKVVYLPCPFTVWTKFDQLTDNLDQSEKQSTLSLNTIWNAMSPPAWRPWDKILTNEPSRDIPCNKEKTKMIEWTWATLKLTRRSQQSR